MLLISPPLRAFAQFDDPVFVGVVVRSVVLAIVTFLILAAGMDWAVAELVANYARGGWVAWIAGLFGAFGVAALSLWLFLPLATVIATLFTDRVADAVERRFYPALPPARAAPLADQFRDGLDLGLRVLGLQIVALVLGILLPGVGLVLGLAISGWAIGRGLFVALAMRRMDRAGATALYRQLRPAVLVQGGLIAVAGLVPFLNLVVPVLGMAALVHVLHLAGDRR